MLEVCGCCCCCLLAAARFATELDITLGIFLGEGAGVDSDEDVESSSSEELVCLLAVVGCVFLIAFVLDAVVFLSNDLLVLRILLLFTVFRTDVGFLGLSFFSVEGTSFLPLLSSLELELLEEPESLEADPLSLSLELSELRSDPLEDALDESLELESDESSIF